jgi:hypothetical protein
MVFLQAQQEVSPEIVRNHTVQELKQQQFEES